MSAGHSPSSASASRRDRLILAGIGLLLLAGLVLAARATGWSELAAQISRLGPLQLAALLGLSLVNYALRGLRWHLFARRLGLPLGLRRNLLHFLAGLGLSVTPGRLGELVRLRWIARETGWPAERLAPLALVDRAADLAACGLLLALALLAGSGPVAGALPVAALALAGAVAVTRPGPVARLAGLAHRLFGRARLFARARRAARALARIADPRTMAAATLLGLAGWAAEGLAFHALLSWLGAEAGLWRAVAIFVFATLAGGLTGAPGGLGGAEAAMVALLALDGVPLEIALPATAIIRLSTLWFAIALGLALVPLAERQGGRDALEAG